MRNPRYAREGAKVPMIICDPCYVEGDAKTHKKAVRHTFRLIDTGSAAPGPLKDTEIDLCPECVERFKKLQGQLAAVVRGIK